VANHTLLCPFLDDSKTYALGVEFGMIWAKFQDSSIDEIKDFIMTDNEEQIILAANRLGWIIEKINNTDQGGGWTWIEMRRI